MKSRECQLIFRATSLAQNQIYLQEDPERYKHEIALMETTPKISPTTKEKAPADILFSDVILLSQEGNYVILQLNSENSSFQLLLERGKKNNDYTVISLYKRGLVQHTARLYGCLDWKLAYLSPGDYQICFDEICAFSFWIKE